MDNKKMGILVAEDDKTSRNILNLILTKWDFDVIAVENGKLALNILQNEDAPKLVLLDWNMPEIDGLDVIRAVRSMNELEQPYIILLTSKSERNDVILGLSAKANDYIIKPYDRDELRSRLEIARHTIDLQLALSNAAKYDPMTGALNRGTIIKKLEKEILLAKRNSTPLAVALIDINHFKKVNEEHGYLAGDNLLIAFCIYIQSILGTSNNFGRFEGDQFMIIESTILSPDLEAYFNKFCLSLSQKDFCFGQKSISTSFSLGVSVLKEESNIDSLLTAVEEALFKSKQLGQNHAFYS